MKKLLYVIILSLQGGFLQSALSLNLVNAAQSGDESTILSILADPEFRSIQVKDIGHALRIAAETGKENVVKIILDNSRIISGIDVGWALHKATEIGHENIIKCILRNQRYIPVEFLDSSLRFAAVTGNENIVNIMMNDSRSKDIPKRFLEDILMKTTQSGNGNTSKIISNWFKAYTALKSESELTDLTQIENQFIQAYEEFRNCNKQNLCNLIFPVGKSGTSYIYALSPQVDTQRQAFNIIDAALMKLFKKEHVASLLLALVDTQGQKGIALDHLKYMGLLETIKNNDNNYVAQHHIAIRRQRDE